MAKILVLNGPNLNMLGTREPDVYGDQGLNSINAELETLAAASKHDLSTFQSNAEHELVDRIQQAHQEGVAYIIINPAAFTHSSVALRDALLAVDIPFIEVHISNIHTREEFRKHSYFSDKAVGVICGLGITGYEMALRTIIKQLNN